MPACGGSTFRGDSRPKDRNRPGKDAVRKREKESDGGWGGIRKTKTDEIALGELLFVDDPMA